MEVPADEPTVAHWEPVTDTELASRLGARLPAAGSPLILVDGRSGGGKTTLAGRVAQLLGCAVVHTDDVAWHHSMFDWADALVDGIITPWRQGREVSFRPPGWAKQGRGGTIDVPARAPLVVEGVGAGRAELARRADLVVWVQSDRTQARRRGISRDVSLGRTPSEAAAFWDDWMRAEDPFLAEDRPWRRASFLVNGTPVPPAGGLTFIAPGPAASPHPRG